ncbi:HmuY family protein [Mucilaginibacter ginsenosidivorax]|uniref:HmuY family protein n=1 Tax=Mucilaginibacter ginsenosidivorax TaxID=862126 RepID=A0A5B8W5D3_9SPHI|nr:HmuY family protein [Mucilaginibacter ginsenosidivorax]QEC78983.1 hypothetical protein FSB76_24665 [Mucilaginibacter ginsenosidivorax]
MNKFTTLSLALSSAIILLASSCSKNSDNATPAVSKLSTKTVTDLDGSTTNVYYSLSTGTQITGADTATTKWDIKFKGTSIFINGGTSGTGTTQAQIVSSTFETLAAAPTAGYKTDAAGTPAISGWYTYTATTEPQHAILTVPGKIIVIKTSAGNYAKVEMISYYKGNPNTTTAEFANLATRPASRYYTFRFAYQGDGTTSLQ